MKTKPKLTKDQITALEAVERGDVFLDHETGDFYGASSSVIFWLFGRRFIRHDKQSYTAKTTTYRLTETGRTILEASRKENRMSNNRSTKFLMQRMKIAKEAGKIHTGEWGTDIRPYLKMAAVCADNGEPLCTMTMDDDIVTAAHIASSDPETTLCDIKEILRLRAENKRLNKMTKILAGESTKQIVKTLASLSVTQTASGWRLGATDEDGDPSYFPTKEDAVQSWLDKLCDNAEVE